jgi:C1A family cysteine protease
MSRHITPNGRGMGWRPSLPVYRRAMMFASPFQRAALPPMVDLTAGCPPIYDQGQLGSCMGNALAFAVQFDRIRQGLPDAARVPSRLMIYYLGRELEGTVASDSGAQGYDGITALQRTGTCYEDGPDGWPYDVAMFAVRPPAACYAAAANDRAVQALQISQDIDQVRGCLADGFPVAFGFTCYPALDSEAVARSGLLPMPGAGEEPIGGHEVAAVGYDDASRLLLVRNSWGTGWGQAGYFRMPYEYLIRRDLASELVTIRLVSGP